MEREIWGFNLEHLKKVMESRSLEKIELKPGQIILTKRVTFLEPISKKKFYAFDITKVLEVLEVSDKGTRIQKVVNVFNFFEGNLTFRTLRSNEGIEGIVKDDVFSANVYTLECGKGYYLQVDNGSLGGQQPLAGIWLLAEE